MASSCAPDQAANKLKHLLKAVHALALTAVRQTHSSSTAVPTCWHCTQSALQLALLCAAAQLKASIERRPHTVAQEC
eukprot:11720-Heterococcus_DN1.PRE.2